MNIVLRRWHEKLGNSEFNTYSNCKLSSAIWNEETAIIGAFAKYKEGSFCYWLNDGSHFVAWNDNVIEVQPSDEISWSVDFLGRELKIIRNNIDILNFRYHTLFKYPFDILDEN